MNDLLYETQNLSVTNKIQKQKQKTENKKKTSNSVSLYFGFLMTKANHAMIECTASQLFQ